EAETAARHIGDRAGAAEADPRRQRIREVYLAQRRGGRNEGRLRRRRVRASRPRGVPSGVEAGVVRNCGVRRRGDRQNRRRGCEDEVGFQGLHFRYFLPRLALQRQGSFVENRRLRKGASIPPRDSTPSQESTRSAICIRRPAAGIKISLSCGKSTILDSTPLHSGASGGAPLVARLASAAAASSRLRASSSRLRRTE